MSVKSPAMRRNLTVDQTRCPSDSLWADCDFEAIRTGEISGIAFRDDFTDFGLPGTQTTEINLGRYKVYNTGAGVIQYDDMPHTTTPAGGMGGVISMLTDTDGDQSVIGTQTSPISLDTTQVGKMWFEARVALTSILTNMGQFFLGLCENGVVTYGAAIPLANANATASTCAMIGFNRLEDGLNVLNTSYADHAAAWTDIQASANTTLAANTWIKLGIKFDPKDTTRCVRFFVDNIECTSAMTKTALAALSHVDAKGLGPCMAFFADSAGTANYCYLDWWQYAQTY